MTTKPAEKSADKNGVSWDWDNAMRLTITMPGSRVMVLDFSNMPAVSDARARMYGYHKYMTNAVAGDAKSGNWGAFADTLRAQHMAFRFGLARRDPAADDLPDAITAVGNLRRRAGLGRNTDDDIRADIMQRGMDWFTTLRNRLDVKREIAQIKLDRATAIAAELAPGDTVAGLE